MFSKIMKLTILLLLTCIKDWIRLAFSDLLQHSQLQSFYFICHHYHYQTFVFFLKPVFSELGSNSHVFEEKTYGLFIKYATGVADGSCEKLNFGNILWFAT